MSAQSELPSIANLSISSPTSITNGLTYSSHSSPPSEPIQISIPLPNTHIPTRIHIHLTINPTSLLLFITTRFGSAPQAEQPHTSALADTTELAAAEADVASGDAPPLLVDPFAAREQERPTTAGGVEMGSFVVAIPNVCIHTPNALQKLYPPNTSLYNPAADLFFPPASKSYRTTALHPPLHSRIYLRNNHANCTDFSSEDAATLLCWELNGFWKCGTRG